MNVTVIRAKQPDARTLTKMRAHRMSLMLRTISFGTRLCSLERWVGFTLAALFAFGCAVDTTPPNSDSEAAVRIDVAIGQCIRILPLFDGSQLAYGPSPTELASPDPAHAICDAWVSVGERVWVAHAAVDVEAWPAGMDPIYCSCL